MREICGFIGLTVLFLFLFGMMLSGCTINKTDTISTNNLIQTDYDYNCLDGTKTFTQIILCYQTQDKAEKSQSELTLG